MNKDFLKQSLHSYATWYDDTDFRARCATGGFVSLLSQWMMQNGAAVYGVRYDAQWKPVYAKASSLQDLEAFKGSKYAYAQVADAYRQVKEDLLKGKVLFVGLPCQVAGLYAYLGGSHSDLITCDLFCHGAAPSSYLAEEIAYLQKRHHLSAIDDVRFRGNDGHNYYLTLWYQGKLIYRKKAQAQYYFQAFLSGISLRETCQQCQYAQLQRVGDFSVGDFIGLGKDIPFEGPIHNTSAVLLNSDKAIHLLTSLSEAYPGLRLVERDVQEVAKWGPALQAQRKRHPKSKEFHALVKQKGWLTASRQSLRKDIARYYMTQVYQTCHHIAHLIKKQLIRKG